MFCPETIVFNRRWLIICRHEESDYHVATPLREVLNPLRYEFCFRPGTPHRWYVNKDARLHVAVDNLVYRLKCRFRKQPT